MKVKRKPRRTGHAEDRADIKAAEMALAGSDERIPYEKVYRELALGLRFASAESRKAASRTKKGAS